MRILLIQPTAPSISKGVSGTICMEPLALEMIASPLLDHHDVTIIDLKIDNCLDRSLTDIQPDLVGVTAYTMEVPDALRITQKVKAFSHDTTTVIGGLHATMFPDAFVTSGFDYLVRGRGEYVFRDLIEHLELKKKLPLSGQLIDLKQFPAKLDSENLWQECDSIKPAHHLVDRYRQHYHLGLMSNCYSIKTSDGCPYKCSFCTVWTYYGGKYYARSAEDVVSEIKSIPGDNIIIVDDNFLFNPKRGYEIARLLKRDSISKRFFIQSRPDTIVNNRQLIEEWKTVGLTMVAIGLDGFRNDELTKWQKQSSPDKGLEAIAILNDLAIQSLGEFIIDTDYTSPDFRELSEYIRRSKVTLIQLSILTPLPGTRLYEERKHELTTQDFAKFNVDFPVLPTKLSLSIFYNKIANLYWLSYIYPPSIIRRIKLGKHNFWQSWRGFWLITSIISHYKFKSWKAFLIEIIQFFIRGRSSHSHLPGQDANSSISHGHQENK